MTVSASTPASPAKLQALTERYRQLSENTVFVVQEGDLYVECRPSDLLEPQFTARLGMISDPAHGGKTNPNTVEEGAVGLWAEANGVVPPLERESTGLSEFTDSQGQNWDVKSPISPPPHQTWIFDAQHQLEVVRDELQGGENVLLNLSRCNPEDSARVFSLMTTHLQSWEKQRVVILMPESDPSQN